MSDAVKRAIERMNVAAGKADREAASRGDSARAEDIERRERCERQAHGLREAVRMLKEELAKETRG